jgi:hypothetical protein
MNVTDLILEQQADKKGIKRKRELSPTDYKE